LMIMQAGEKWRRLRWRPIRSNYLYGSSSAIMMKQPESCKRPIAEFDWLFT